MRGKLVEAALVALVGGLAGKPVGLPILGLFTLVAFLIVSKEQT
jgi:hypothetical protein